MVSSKKANPNKKNVRDKTPPAGYGKSCANCIHRINGKYCPRPRRKKSMKIRFRNEKTDEDGTVDAEELVGEHITTLYGEIFEFEIDGEEAEKLASESKEALTPYNEPCPSWRYRGRYSLQGMKRIAEKSDTRIPRDPSELEENREED